MVLMLIGYLTLLLVIVLLLLLLCGDFNNRFAVDESGGCGTVVVLRLLFDDVPALFSIEKVKSEREKKNH